jgi:hypothetical protein
MGLAAFVVAVVAGLAADNPTENILVRALVSLCGCYAAGFIAGTVAERAVMERIDEYLKTNAIEEPGEARAPGAPAAGGGAGRATVT